MKPLLTCFSLASAFLLFCSLSGPIIAPCMNEKMVKLKQQAELYGIDWDEFQRVAAVEGLGGGGE